MKRSWRARGRGWVADHRVLTVGAALIAAQLAFRAWAVYGSWFQFDDFAWMSMALNEPLSWSFLFQEYGSHLMPGGFLLSWIFAHLDPLNFWLPSTALLVMQAVASIGCLRLLRHLFGDRPGILPPLGLYLFSVISLPSFIWWAAGINALPFQIALFYGLHSHVSYLRTRRISFAVRAMAWTVVGLFFFEKTLYVFLAYGLVALGYFATGWGLERIRSLWSSYRVGVLLYAGVAVAYVAAYSQLALKFNPSTANDYPLGPIATKLVGVAFGTGIVGGPLRWFDRSSFSHTPNPPDLLVLLAWMAIAALVYEVTRTRRNSRRAWLLVAIVLTTDVLLIAAARAFVVGPAIALEYRYQGEITAFAAIGLGLATMTVLGARDPVTAQADSQFLDSRGYVAAACVFVLALSTVSSVQYARKWHAADGPHTYFTNLGHELASRKHPPTVANLGVPEFVLWGLAYPENQQKRMLKMFGAKLRFGTSTDKLMVIDDQGHLRRAIVPPTRTVAPGPRPNCGYFVTDRPRTIAFNGPIIGAGWWIRVGYLAPSTGRIRLTLGSTTFDQQVRPGLNNVFVQADGPFDSITLQTLSPGLRLCTDDVQLGLPVPEPNQPATG